MRDFFWLNFQVSKSMKIENLKENKNHINLNIYIYTMWNEKEKLHLNVYYLASSQSAEVSHHQSAII